MKKWIILFLALLLAGNLSLTALAAEDTLSLSDASGQEGDIVFLAVTLNEPITGNTIGITYSYDASLLLALPESCSWSIKGLIKDFDYNNAGVWASGNTQELSGTICILAFQLKAPLTAGTTVSCSVRFKDGATDLGTYTAEATVSTTCDHQFSDWSDSGAIGHNRVCTLCGAPQTQSHTWDEGVLSENPDNPFSQLKTYTCSVCSGSKSVEVFIQKEEEEHFTEPTIPQVSSPTIPTTQPTEQPRPTSPGNREENHTTIPTTSSTQNQQQTTQPTYRDYNQPEPSGQSSQTQQNYHVHADGSIHYENHEDSASISVNVPDTTVSSDSSDAESHNHTHETQPSVSKQARQGNMVLFIVLVCLMFAAGALYLKKKK